MHVVWNGKLHQNPRSGDHTETDHVLETILKPYFKTASFNREGINEPFAFNSHCSHERQPSTYGTTIKIPTGPITRHCTFWERRMGFPTERKESPHIRLMIDSNYAGLLCPETQTIWATGWTHLEEYWSMTQHVVNFLAKQGLLKTLPPAPKKKRVEKEKQVFDITIGGDPEFEVSDNDDMIIRANDECEFAIRKEFGNIGVDGSGDQVEIRPSPGSPETVVENVRKLLKEFNVAYGENFKLAASSDEYPCGGHIHIGVSPLPDKDYYGKLSRILDEFIGKNTSKLNGPARESGNENGYGRIGDYRSKPHGMEYRTPPSAIWKNPAITKVVLKLVYNLATNLINNLGLEFPTPVEKETLVVIGGLSDKEANIFLQECAKPAPDNTECLLAAWERQRTVPKPKIRITFRDSWHSSIKTILNRELSKVAVSSNINLTFYGLREDRGDVYTFEIPGLVKIPHPHGDSGPTYFGFSKRFRSGNTSGFRIVEIPGIIGRMVMELQNSKVNKSPAVEEPINPWVPDIGTVFGMDYQIPYRYSWLCNSAPSPLGGVENLLTPDAQEEY